MRSKEYVSPLSYLFSTENLNQIKGIVGQFNQVFDDEFWSNVLRLNQLLRGRPGGTIPYELWENDQHYFVPVFLAGIKNSENLRIHFRNNYTLVIKIKCPLFKPAEDSTLVQSENDFADREITLSQPVQTDDYEVDFEEEILVIKLNKLNQNITRPLKIDQIMKDNHESSSKND